MPLALLVEDSPTQALEVTLALESIGFDVVRAENGLMGLNMAYDHHPALVVLDVNLPEMNGYQVCNRLKRDPETSSIPVILLTASASSDDMLTGLEAGADDYIPKDEFAAENLIASVKSMNING